MYSLHGILPSRMGQFDMQSNVIWLALAIVSTQNEYVLICATSTADFVQFTQNGFHSDGFSPYITVFPTDKYGQKDQYSIKLWK